MRVVVTGGAGFIGSTLVDALVERGDTVTVVDNLSRGQRTNVNNDASFVEMDIVDPALRDVLAAAQPEVLFHHAAQIDVRYSMIHPQEDANTNVVGTVNVFSAAQGAGCRRIVFASSGGTVYGDAESLPTREEAPYQPTSNYGAAKVSGEIYGEMFSRLTGIEFVSLRYGNVYGPRQDPHGEAGVVAIFIERLLREEHCIINGDGRQTRDYVYVDDVVAANLAAANFTAPQGPFNIGTGRQVDVNEIFGAAQRACGVEATAAHGPAKAGEQQHSCLAIEKAKRVLGWSPRVTLDDGMARTALHFRSRLGRPV